MRSARRRQNSISARGTRGNGEATSHKLCQGTGDGAKETTSTVHSRALPSAGRISADLERYLVNSIPGQSPAMLAFRQRLLRVLQSRSTLLITGETGTGKSRLVDHILKSMFPGVPFVVLDSAATARSFIESQLFGYEQGAFLGATTTKPSPLESADGGIVLLDEIGGFSLDEQRKLLRLLEDGSFRRVGGSKWYQMHARIIALTNRDLVEMVRQGLFRSDLFYRLNCLSLRLPALRETGEDILRYARRFLAWYCWEHGKCIKGLTAAAERSLLDYDWPGNIRELKNVIDRAVVFCDSEVLDSCHVESAIIPIPVERTAPSDKCSAAADPAPEQMERLSPAQKSFISLLGIEIRKQLQDAANGRVSGGVSIRAVERASVLAATAALGPRVTQNQIGQFLGISQSKVSRILAGDGIAA